MTDLSSTIAAWQRRQAELQAQQVDNEKVLCCVAVGVVGNQIDFLGTHCGHVALHESACCTCRNSLQRGGLALLVKLEHVAQRLQQQQLHL